MSRKRPKDSIVLVEVKMPATKFVALTGNGGSPSYVTTPRFVATNFAEAITQARKMGWSQSQISKAEKGFVTKDWQFLSKKTATKLAIETGQFGTAITAELIAGRLLNDKDLIGGS